MVTRVAQKNKPASFSNNATTSTSSELQILNDYNTESETTPTTTLTPITDLSPQSSGNTGVVQYGGSNNITTTTAVATANTAPPSPSKKKTTSTKETNKKEVKKQKNNRKASSSKLIVPVSSAEDEKAKHKDEHNDDEDDLALEKGKLIEKKERNYFNSFVSRVFSIKFCLSLITIMLILISTITIFVATIVLQGASIDEFTTNLGAQTKLRTVEFVNNFIKKPFQITEGLTRSISTLDKLSPNMTSWNTRIQLLYAAAVGFDLTYTSFTSREDYYFAIAKKSTGFKIEYYQNGLFFEDAEIDSNSKFNLTRKDPQTLDESIYEFEWWTLPIQTKAKGWSSLYGTANAKTNVWITAYHPILNSTGEVTAVVTTDLTVDDINKYLSSIKMSPNSMIYVISSLTSEMIACSKPSTEVLYVYDAMSPHNLVRKNLEESSIPDVAEIGRLLRQKYGPNLKEFTGNDNQYTVNGNQYLLNMESVTDDNDLNWNVLIIMSVDDFMGSVIWFRNIVLIADCVILLFSLIIAVVVSMLITAPLVSLGNDMDSLSKGVVKSNKKRLILFHEVKKLRNHFTKMSMAVEGFMKYVPKEIVSKFIGSDSASFDLGVDSKHIAILFSDIKSFTTICEATEPNTLIAILGKYFEVTSEVVYRNRGVLDKYIGDSLMALFGAPDTFDFYVFFGCNAAFEMQKSLQPYNNQLEKEGKPGLYTRVGVSCGDVLVGNIGSTYRLSYTCLGDSVNLASRLEGLNKVYGTNIMVSEFCYEIVKDLFLFRLLDVVAVKGKVTGVKVYEIVGRKWSPFQGDSVMIPQEKVDYCRIYTNILEELYFKKKFGVAEKAFREYAEKYNSDSAALEMAERCRAYLIDPPPDSWNGVYIATEK